MTELEERFQNLQSDRKHVEMRKSCDVFRGKMDNLTHIRII